MSRRPEPIQIRQIDLGKFVVVLLLSIVLIGLLVASELFPPPIVP